MALAALAAWPGCTAPGTARTQPPAASIRLFRNATAATLHAGRPDASAAELMREGRTATGRLRVDGRDPPIHGATVAALLRFDDLLAGGSLVGSEVEIHQALLRLHIHGRGSGARLLRLTSNWDAATSWSSFGRAAGPEWASDREPDACVRRVENGVVEIDVTSSVRAWAAGEANHGWLLLANGNDGWEFYGPQAADPALRPELLVLCSRTQPRVAVASGDVTPDGVVLWAFASVAGPVRFELSRTADFATIDSGLTCTQADALVPVKAPITGLRPRETYFYRATDAAGETASGRFRTPAPAGQRHGLRFGVSGDVDGRLRPFPALANVPQRELDFFVLLGDTIFADDESHFDDGRPARNTQEFRQKHVEVLAPRYGLAYAADLRASTALFATIDDHEVADNFAGAAATKSDRRFENGARPSINRTLRFEAGLRAFQEFHPLRDEYYAADADARCAGQRRLFRARRFGDDAALFVLDTRSFRDAPIPGVFEVGDDPWFKRAFEPGRTLLGQEQLEQLRAGLRAAQRAGITWKFIGIPEPIQNLTPVSGEDRYEGYAAERTELLQFIEREPIQNVVFISADVHGTLVNNLTYQTHPNGRHHRVAAWEITAGPIAFAPPFGPEAVHQARQHERFWGQVLECLYRPKDRDDRDEFLRWFIDRALGLWHHDPLGLDHSPIRARRTQGEWVALHTFGWTEFEIDAASQKLRVRVWGIEWYDAEELQRSPIRVLCRRPQVVTEFEVEPARLRTHVASEWPRANRK